MWLSLPEERKVKLIQQAHAWHYNLFDLKEEVYLKTRTRWSERKKDSAIAAEGLSLVLGEYAKMTKLQLQTLTEEVRYRLATALECGQKAYLKKKAELETLSQSYRT